MSFKLLRKGGFWVYNRKVQNQKKYKKLGSVLPEFFFALKIYDKIDSFGDQFDS